MKLPPICNFMILAAILAFGGCRHIGPRTIVDDRIPYNDAIATSWKQQTLLNIVRLRYMDIPEFVDVPSIVNGYEHGRTASGGIGGELYPNDSIATFLSPELRGSRTMVDRPTITYAPQTGSEFTRNLTNPIPPVSILNLIESGNPADVVMELAVESINGIRNRGYAGTMQQGDAEFHEVLRILREAQASGHVDLRVTADSNSSDPAVLMGFRDEDIPPAVVGQLSQLRQLLRLDPNVREFRIVFGILPRATDEIALRTRSILRILTFLSLDVQVPQCHLADGRAPDLGNPASRGRGQFTVLSSCEQPRDAFVAIQYQGYWFWIEQCDFYSKRTMTYLKVFLALADTKQKDAAPTLTIRAN